MIMFSSSPVCYGGQLFLFTRVTEQNTDDSINHARLRRPTLIPMQISRPMDAGLRIITGTGASNANATTTATKAAHQ